LFGKLCETVEERNQLIQCKDLLATRGEKNVESGGGWWTILV
jgi:hypothetical protein